MSVIDVLPRGARMTPESWAARHRVLTVCLWATLPVLLLVGLVGPMGWVETLVVVAAVGALGVASRFVGTGGPQAELTSLGLIASAFAGIELSGGQVHAHLFLLSMVALVSLYQRWSPLLITVGAVVVHHLTLGLMAPDRVFNLSMGTGMTMHMSFGAVLGMVLVHAAAVVLEVVGILLMWHFAEIVEREAAAAAEAAEAHRHRADQDRLEAQTREVEAEQHRTEAMAAVAQRVAHGAEEIRGSAGEAVDAVTAVNDQPTMLASAVREISERCQQAASRASDGRALADAAAADVHRLEQSMSEIAEVNQMIAQLAAQTNLLSLNATIEAARAGELGRGFAVVAQEVKALANETASSAEKVRAVVEGVVEDTGTVARNFEASSALIGDIHATQTDIAASVEEQASVLSEVARQTSRASDATQQINRGLDELAAVVDRA